MKYSSFCLAFFIRRNFERLLAINKNLYWEITSNNSIECEKHVQNNSKHRIPNTDHQTICLARWGNGLELEK